MVQSVVVEGVEPCMQKIAQVSHTLPICLSLRFPTVSQDRYVPFHSARIASCGAAQRDPRKGPIYHKMVTALLRGTEGAAGGTATAAASAELTVGDLVTPPPTQLFRVDVDFDLQVRCWVALGKGELDLGNACNLIKINIQGSNGSGT